MDPISLTVISIIVLGTGALITKGLRAQKKKRLRMVRTVLAERGFSGPLFFHGRVAGQRASVNNATLLSPTLTVSFAPPLDLGLIANDSPRNVPYEISFAHDQAFAGGHEVIALEEARAHQLFNTEVRRMLRPRGGMRELQIEDAFLRCKIRGRYGGEDEFRKSLHHACAFVEQFEEARQSVAIAQKLRHEGPRWRALAQRRGWRFGTTPLHMIGQVDAGEVRIQMVLIRNRATNGNNSTAHNPYRFHYEREATLRFLDPLALGLIVAPKTWTGQTAELFGGQDIKTGDALFDDTFRVQAEDVEGAKRVLSAAVRAKLLLIHHDIDPIRLDDDGLTLREKHDATRPEEMVKLVPALEKLARLVQEARTARGDEEQGPYR